MCSARNKICLSRFAEALERSALAESAADLLEVRLDRQPEQPFRTLREQTRLPLIATLRTVAEGGEFSGTPRQMAAVLQGALAAGWDFVDIGYRYWEEVAPHLDFSPAEKLVLSAHLPHADEGGIRKVAEEMLGHPAAVYKLIYTTEDAADFYLVFQLAEFFRSRGKRFVVHAMGADAWSSRILGALAGNAWTYVSGNAGKATAAGQLSLAEAEGIFGLREMPADAKIVGLLGNPVRQSKGWLLHNRFLKTIRNDPAEAANAVYLNFRTARPEDFWQKMSDKIHALSVTIPYKQTAAGWAGQVMPEVEYSGAANSLLRGGGRWQARNGDVLAVRKILENYRDLLEGGVGILGSGGAAAAVAAALKMLRVQNVVVLGRSAKKAARLAGRFGFASGEIRDANQLKLSALIQTTPVGTAPRIDEVLPVEKALKSVRFALEAVYNPAETRFLRIGRQSGAVAVSGVEWFLEQARLQAEWFYGLEVKPEAIRAVWNEISETKES